jgi:antitoxin component of MazEF toxin-antitoxin module
MVKTLIKHGNSYALVIDKPILELLRATPDTPLELTTNGDTLMVSPVRDAKRERRLRQSLEKMNRRYGDDLKRLAE